MRFLPSKNRLTIRPIIQQTQSGIYIPETANTEYCAQGEVIESSIEGYTKGDKILYRKGHGITFKLNNEDLAIIHDDVLLGKFDG